MDQPPNLLLSFFRVLGEWNSWFNIQLEWITISFYVYVLRAIHVCSVQRWWNQRNGESRLCPQALPITLYTLISPNQTTLDSTKIFQMPETYPESDFSTNVCAVWKKELKKRYWVFQLRRRSSGSAGESGTWLSSWEEEPDFVFREIWIPWLRALSCTSRTTFKTIDKFSGISSFANATLTKANPA